MLGESRLNVYILGADLSARQRERVQAQIQTALRAIPAWAVELLRRRIDELGIRNLPLIVEPQVGVDSRVLSLGRIDAKPAVRLMPRLVENGVQWGQDLHYLLAKAIAYMAASGSSDVDFWARWSGVVKADRIRENAADIDEQWGKETNLGLLLEMFAAYALNPDHKRWSEMPHVRSFLDEWRAEGELGTGSVIS